MKRALFGFFVVALLFGLDSALASVAVEMNAAGALLSPGGAVRFEAFAVAAAFLLTRLGFASVFCVGAAVLAWSAVRWAWPARAAGS